MKTSRSRIFAFLLLFVFALASSVMAMQTALGSSQSAGLVNQIFLPLVRNDSLSLPTSTPTGTSTPTITPTPTPSTTGTSSPTVTPTPTPTPSCVEPPAGLVSWWPAEGNADDIQGSNDGTMLNGATFEAGMVGQAFSFTGYSRVSAPTTDLPIGDSDRTLDLWVKVNTFFDGEAFFAGYGNFGTYDQSYHLGTAGSTLFFSQWGQAIFGPALQTGRWYHVAVTNVGNAVTLYLDGAIVARGDMPIDTPSSTLLFIGSLPNESAKRLNGRVDELDVYSRALSISEIHAIYSAGYRGKCRGLLPESPTPTPSPTGTSTPTITPTPTPTSTSMPELKLAVTQSPLAIYPPIMIYTAQLSYMPPTPSAQLKVDFYNISGTKVEYLGSAPVNQAGQAVLSKQIHPGTYSAIARVVINSHVIWSNIVTYKVR